MLSCPVVEMGRLWQLRLYLRRQSWELHARCQTAFWSRLGFERGVNWSARLSHIKRGCNDDTPSFAAAFVNRRQAAKHIDHRGHSVQSEDVGHNSDIIQAGVIHELSPTTNCSIRCLESNKDRIKEEQTLQKAISRLSKPRPHCPSPGHRVPSDLLAAPLSVYLKVPEVSSD